MTTARDQQHAMHEATLVTESSRSDDAVVVAEAAILASRRYKEGDELARGSGGRIIHAYDVVLARDVVLKVPHHAGASDAGWPEPAEPSRRATPERQCPAGCPPDAARP